MISQVHLWWEYKFIYVLWRVTWKCLLNIKMHTQQMHSLKFVLQVFLYFEKWYMDTAELFVGAKVRQQLKFPSVENLLSKL